MSMNLEYTGQCFDKSVVDNFKKCFFELKADLTPGLARAFSTPYNIPIETYRNHTSLAELLPLSYIGNKPVGSVFMNLNSNLPDIHIVLEKNEAGVIALRFCEKNMVDNAGCLNF